MTDHIDIDPSTTGERHVAPEAPATPVQGQPCAATTKEGAPCRGPALVGGPYCQFHSPDTKPAMDAGRLIGGVRYGLDLGPALDVSSLEGLQEVVRAALAGVAVGKITTSQATAITGLLRVAADLLDQASQKELKVLHDRLNVLLDAK
jgi:hypothetical protein